MAKGEKLTDIELWDAIKQGDQKAFDALFEKYWSLMYTTSYNYLRNATLSSEIVHDIFLNIWKKRKEFQIYSIKNYLSAATRYHVYKYLRERKASSLIYVDNYTDTLSIQQKNDGEEKLERIDLENSMNIHLRQLPKRCREIFVMSRMQQMNNDEIAAHLGISKRTVENQLTTALKYLSINFKHIAVLFISLIKYFNIFFIVLFFVTG